MHDIYTRKSTRSTLENLWETLEIQDEILRSSDSLTKPFSNSSSKSFKAHVKLINFDPSVPQVSRQIK